MGFPSVRPDMGVALNALPFHPRTGLQALGFTSRGPIWPVMGGSQPGHPAAPPAGSPADPPPVIDSPPSPPPDRGFPENTPIVEMTTEQQVAYWKFHDRRKSDTLRAYDGITPEQAKQFKEQAEEAHRQGLDDAQRAIEDARTEATTAATTAEAAKWAPKLLKSVAGRFIQDEQQLNSFLAVTDASRFMKDGEFDEDAVIGHLTGIFGAAGAGAGGQQQQSPPRQWGQSGSTPPAQSAKDAGLAEARRRGYIKD